MKPIILAAVAISIFVAFACNNQNNKKENREDTISRKHNKLIISNYGKAEQFNKNTREKIIKEIVTTSPRFKQLTKGLNDAVVKNGGQFFGISLEGSPNPKTDRIWSYSKTYDFTLYEMYEERQLNTARFSFDPVNKQLYEYDAVKDKLMKIDFDRSLLLEYNALSN
jgi:hypothetical protein